MLNKILPARIPHIQWAMEEKQSVFDFEWYLSYYKQAMHTNFINEFILASVISWNQIFLRSL